MPYLALKSSILKLIYKTVIIDGPFNSWICLFDWIPDILLAPIKLEFCCISKTFHHNKEGVSKPNRFTLMNKGVLGEDKNHVPETFMEKC